jgi:single-strand DNA-binding protein
MNIPAPPTWPRPPACLPHDRLDIPPNGARIAVAGLVLVRQRPGTAKGVIFITLEDETGISNVIVWRKMYERFRRAVIAGRALKVTGRVQREGGVTHVIAEQIEDISFMLDELTRPKNPRVYQPSE